MDNETRLIIQAIAAVTPAPPDGPGSREAYYAVPLMLARCRGDVPKSVEWLAEGHPDVPVVEGWHRFCAKATYEDGKIYYAPYEMKN